MTAFLLVRPSSKDLWSQPIEGDPGIIEELKLFSKAIGVILQAYVEERSARSLFYDAVKGMVASLDSYSEFIGKDKYELLKISMSGVYAGIGAKLEIVEGYPSLAEIQPGSAAEKAGLLALDRILKVDGVSMKDKPLEEAASLLRGDENTALVLNVLRPSVHKAFDVKVLREKIEIEAVHDVRLLGRALGYMRISDFRDNTAEQVGEALKGLHARGMKALIVDLRGNQGGLLTEAVELAERFLQPGQKIVSVQSKIDEQRKEYVAAGKEVEPGYPMIVLVNEGSASATEILSAALQEAGRARIIGTKTFGKASVQSVVPLDDVTAIKLTTARYVSPKGRVIDRIGVEPDEVVINGDPDQPGGDRQTNRALELMGAYL